MHKILKVLLLCLLLTACQPGLGTPAPQENAPAMLPATASASPLPPTEAVRIAAGLPALIVAPRPPASTTPEILLSTDTPLASTSVPSAAPASFSLWIDPTLPEALRSQVIVPLDVVAVPSRETAMLRLEISTERPVSRWIYALAAPFPTLSDGVTFDTLRRAWRGEAVGPFAGQPILVDESTRATLSAAWGEAPAAQAVLTLPTQGLLDAAWKQRSGWAIIPFEAIEPRWKVLEIDGQSPLHKNFDVHTYPLSVSISLTGDPVLAEALKTVYGATLTPASNRDPQRLTTLAMTGVTALVRSTAYAMEKHGINYPAEDIAGWLTEADLAHVSNEVPFAQGCPYPDPFQQGMRFCSDPRYIKLLETIGADIIELSGDHFQDWGEEATLYTLELYKQEGWRYYGGGANSEEARQPLLVEHNGNRLAFIGCNAKGGGYAQAGPEHAGAVACDFEYIESQIASLRAQGYLPIATFQHFEYYTYEAQPDQLRDFHRLAQAGAVIVSGSQAHQPQGMDFLNGAFIHYGLGNLFFDQYEVSLATRQAFVDRHIFYDGRYLGSELLTMMFIDYARPRPMTLAERQELLQAVFAASGW